MYIKPYLVVLEPSLETLEFGKNGPKLKAHKVWKFEK
jgi:hypothetical protein